MFLWQIEDCNEPYIDSLRQYDDGKDLSQYDFKQDDFTTPTDDLNKRKLAYRHRAAAHKYEKVRTDTSSHVLFGTDVKRLSNTKILSLIIAGFASFN